MAVALEPMEAAAVSSSRCRRPVMYTWAPSLASCLAVARPMPELPPVTRATLPSSFPGMVFLPCRCVYTGHTGQPGDTLACPGQQPLGSPTPPASYHGV